ncbi:phospholipase A and acyltransferase 4 [Microcebus murinus]|uniref:Phospholipase A and acyltransferase 4 n=1 Tax=Microcebus murinus TaxID=30608 RepID=A0A8C6EKG2_MICMU
MASSRQEPEPGDLIEIFRKVYEHWAIYVGGGYVVHLAPPSEYAGTGSSSSLSLLTRRAVVKLERLEHVVEGCDYRVNNQLDRTYRPRPVRDIIKSAREMVGKEMKYSLVTNNCEHFVTNLRYGEARCLQVERAKQDLEETSSTVFFGALAVAGFSALTKIILHL